MSANAANYGGKNDFTPVFSGKHRHTIQIPVSNIRLATNIPGSDMDFVGCSEYIDRISFFHKNTTMPAANTNGTLVFEDRGRWEEDLLHRYPDPDRIATTKSAEAYSK
ncbi:MAG: hypothetical protein RLY31_57 [Bacteroidota bacterium]|jgi:hypothetical protein